MNQQQKAQEKKIAYQALPSLSRPPFLTICCHNTQTLFHSRFSALKILIFLLKIIREAVTVNIPSLFRTQIVHFFAKQLERREATGTL